MKPPLPGYVVQLGVRAFYKLAGLLPIGRAFLETRQTQTPITLACWFWQRILGVNGGAYWAMHPASEVVWPQHICIG
ncbi:hypothetical protein AAEH73_22005, partial [Shewanella algae]|uniref:hypothetical protein n=1 Tax=Shewanella algae TaxID=38313 RepID=UPI00313A97F3